MIPVVTPEEMAAIDAAAPEPVEVLIDRAGAATARTALHMLGGAYGRRVVVVAGKGNNGADGRSAAAWLRRRGVRVKVVDAASSPSSLPPAHLVIDAAYGTGFRGSYAAPDPGRVPVVAVDIPSGVDGLTGQAGPGAVQADATVTFAALKPGLLFGDGPQRAGDVRLVDIGLDAESVARAHLVEDADLAAGIPSRPRDSHKWRTAVFVAAGSPGMMGAPVFVSRAAMRAGAGYVRLGVPGASLDELPAGLEVVATSLPAQGWAAEVLKEAGRCKAVVMGPGLGRQEPTMADVRRVVAESPVPVVVDADGLAAIDGVVGRPDVVLTPHEGEFERVAGHRPGPDRLDAARSLASRLGAVVLLKGPATVVAEPGGRVLIAAASAADARLATAGTGDVLSGVIAGFLAAGVPALEAAAFAAHAGHRASGLGAGRGFVAGDLIELLPTYLSSLHA